MFLEPTPAEVRAKLADIYARREFSPRAQGWLERLWQAIFDFFQWLGGLQEVAPAFFWPLILGLLFILFVLLGHIGWTVRRVLYASSGDAGHLAREQRQRLSQTYLEDATRSAEQQDFTEAIRFLFLSLVYRFDETGKVDFQQAYTNREYLRLFADNPTLQANLRVFVDILDDCWYGERPTDVRQYQDCLALFATMR